MSQIMQLPPELAHLQSFYAAGTPDLGADASAGINAMSRDRISIKRAKFRLVDKQGNETMVGDAINVIFVDANPHVSKMFYAGAYDSSSDDNAPPTCWSDNGVAPSSRVTAPQCHDCKLCPWNQVGSKITPAGKPIRACSDSKRLAVILADNPTGPIYELKVPPASLSNMGNAFRTYQQQKVRIETLVWQLTFEDEAEYPKLIFTPISYITAAHAGEVQKRLGSPEAADIVNKHDTPIIEGTKVAFLGNGQPVQTITHQPQPQTHAPIPGNFPSAAAPALPTPAAPAATFAPVYTAPAPSVQPVAVALPPAPAAPMPTYQAPVAAAQPQMGMPPIGGEPPKKRTRKPKAEAASEAPAVAAFTPQAPAAFTPPPAMPLQPPAAFNPTPQAPAAPAFTPMMVTPAAPPTMDTAHAMPAAASVAVQPGPTSNELDNLLSGLNL